MWELRELTTGFSVQFSCSVVSALCDLMDCSIPGLPFLHCLPELAQTHVHQVGDAIQPSLPLSSPSPPVVQWSEVKSLSCVRLFSTPWTLADQAPLSMGFSRQQSWSGLPLYIEFKEVTNLCGKRKDWVSVSNIRRMGRPWLGREDWKGIFAWRNVSKNMGQEWGVLAGWSRDDGTDSNWEIDLIKMMELECRGS